MPTETPANPFPLDLLRKGHDFSHAISSENFACVRHELSAHDFLFLIRYPAQIEVAHPSLNPHQRIPKEWDGTTSFPAATELLRKSTNCQRTTSFS